THELPTDKSTTIEAASDDPMNDKSTSQAPSKENHTTEDREVHSTNTSPPTTTSPEATWTTGESYATAKTGTLPESTSEAISREPTTSDKMSGEKTTSVTTSGIVTDETTTSRTMRPQVTNVVSADTTVSEAATPRRTTLARTTRSSSLPGRRTPKTESAGGSSHPEDPPGLEPSINRVSVVLALDADYGSCVRGREWQFR
ncbi:unnamed protein product, partial [Ixodes hexagonus]